MSSEYQRGLQDAARYIENWANGWKSRIAEGRYQGETLRYADVRRDEGMDLANHIRSFALLPVAPPREEVRALLHDCIERRIGEHDMMRCKICDVMGHNDVVGHPYGIKHKPDCSWLAALAATPTQPEKCSVCGTQFVFVPFLGGYYCKHGLDERVAATPTLRVQP